MFHYNVNWLEDYKGQYKTRKMMQFNDISHPGDGRCEAAIEKAQELVADGKEAVEVVKILHGIRTNGTRVWPTE